MARDGERGSASLLLASTKISSGCDRATSPSIHTVIRFLSAFFCTSARIQIAI